MNGKKVASFLLLLPAFSSRNMTSLALVALFFGVYWASGGRVTAIPRVHQGSGFGSVSPESYPSPETLEKEKPAAQESTISRGDGLIARSMRALSHQRLAKPTAQPAPVAPVVTQEQAAPVSEESNQDDVNSRLSNIQERLNRVRTKSVGATGK